MAKEPVVLTTPFGKWSWNEEGQFIHYIPKSENGRLEQSFLTRQSNDLYGAIRKAASLEFVRPLPVDLRKKRTR